MEVKTVIVIRGGMVSEVFSTLHSSEHEVEILDMDSDEPYSPANPASLSNCLREVVNSIDYYTII